MSKNEVRVEVTEIEQANNLPALYIYCDLSNIPSAMTRNQYMTRVKRMFDDKLPDHLILVGDVKMEFAYITPQKLMYHELKQDHRFEE